MKFYQFFGGADYFSAEIWGSQVLWWERCELITIPDYPDFLCFSCVNGQNDDQFEYCKSNSMNTYFSIYFSRHLEWQQYQSLYLGKLRVQSEILIVSYEIFIEVDNFLFTLYFVSVGNPPFELNWKFNANAIQYLASYPLGRFKSTKHVSNTWSIVTWLLTRDYLTTMNSNSVYITTRMLFAIGTYLYSPITTLFSSINHTK